MLKKSTVLPRGVIVVTSNITVMDCPAPTVTRFVVRGAASAWLGVVSVCETVESTACGGNSTFRSWLTATLPTRNCAASPLPVSVLLNAVGSNKYTRPMASPAPPPELKMDPCNNAFAWNVMLVLAVLVNVRNTTLRADPDASVHPPNDWKQMLAPVHAPVLRLFGYKLPRISDHPAGISPAPTKMLGVPTPPVMLSLLNGIPNVEPPIVARPTAPKAWSG